MAATGHLVLLVALIAAVAGYRRDDDPKCTDGSGGQLTGTPVKLQPVPLKPNIAAWDLTIDSDGACKPLNQAAAGLSLHACDPDAPQPPTVTVTSVSSATVTRNSNLQDPATVEIIVFCQ